MAKALDLIGKQFGELLVVKRERNRKGVYWVCKCNCGSETTVRSDALRYGGTKSCGCYREANRSVIGKTNATIHGLCGTKGYRVWNQMMDRCYNKNCKSYKYYGARGIKVCKRWHDPANFIEDMGQPPKGLSIERINNDKSYSKKNCKWATRSEQQQNRRGKEWFVIYPNGEKIKINNLARFCRQNNLNSNCMSSVAKGKLKQHRRWKCQYT